MIFRNMEALGISSGTSFFWLRSLQRRKNERKGGKQERCTAIPCIRESGWRTFQEIW